MNFASRSRVHIHDSVMRSEQNTQVSSRDILESANIDIFLNRRHILKIEYIFVKHVFFAFLFKKPCAESY